jgi:hypothetical protein
MRTRHDFDAARKDGTEVTVTVTEDDTENLFTIQVGVKAQPVIINPADRATLGHLIAGDPV